MRPAFVACDNLFEPLEQPSVGHVEPIGSAEGGVSMSISRAWVEGKRTGALVLNKAYPGSLPAVARAQPYIVRVRESDFNGKVGTQTMRVGVFFVKPGSYLMKTARSLFVRYRPFSRELWILQPIIE